MYGLRVSHASSPLRPASRAVSEAQDRHHSDPPVYRDLHPHSTGDIRRGIPEKRARSADPRRGLGRRVDWPVDRGDLNIIPRPLNKRERLAVKCRESLDRSLDAVGKSLETSVEALAKMGVKSMKIFRKGDKLQEGWQNVDYSDAQEHGTFLHRTPNINDDDTEEHEEEGAGGDGEDDEGEEEDERIDVPSQYPWEQHPAHFYPRTSTPLSHLRVEEGGTGGVLVADQRRERECEDCRHDQRNSDGSPDYRACLHLPRYSNEDDEDDEDAGDAGDDGAQGN
ncbi:hypothetical protein NMY22_g220 [Coprinellus aureogranulatus]|nr:hypothetical protein NMY22_g220 [Coprinellus aureogranulatus]